jgi:probable F420-dependent oxidoreductase
VDIGLLVPLSSMNATPAFLRALGPAVEERGFESIWVPEHVVLFDDYESTYPYAESGKFPGGGDAGLLDPLVALTYLAAVTDRVRLGTGICLLPQRNPVYTAKQVADLDVLSGGRVDFGIGVGWLKEEFDALNVPFAQRGKRTDEYLEILRSLWTEPTSSFAGDLYTLPPARLYPKPVQAPLPVHVGGESPAAMRRAARHGQGWFTFNRLPDELPEALGQLDRRGPVPGRRFQRVRQPVLPPDRGRRGRGLRGRRGRPPHPRLPRLRPRRPRHHPRPTCDRRPGARPGALVGGSQHNAGTERYEPHQPLLSGLERIHRQRRPTTAAPG